MKGGTALQLKGSMNVNQLFVLPIFRLGPMCSYELDEFQDLVSKTCIHFFTWLLKTHNSIKFL